MLNKMYYLVANLEDRVSRDVAHFQMVYQFMVYQPVPIAQVVERPLREREVAGSKTRPRQTKGVKNGTSGYLAKKKKKKKKTTPSTWFTGTRLMSPSGAKTYRKIDSL